FCFSSRRRHTRFSRDWSSDVCSSDLSIIPTIQQGGGDVFTYADVAEILVHRGKAIGVRMADGQEIRARQVISNAGFQITMEQLLNENAGVADRSEEHTSELQSRENLVCRLQL